MNSTCRECQSFKPNQLFEEEQNKIVFKEWKKVDERIQRITVILEDIDDIIDVFNHHLRTLKRHIYVKRIQNAKLNSLKANLKNNEVLIQVDYSENYVNKSQHQIQSAYFRQQSFSIFTACCYLNIEGLLVNENVTITSEASNHSRIAALSCWLRILSFIQEKYPSLQKSLVLHIWSDGCAGQFRLRFVFSLLTQFAVNHKLFWYYNERHHGKCPMDGISGTIKHRVFRDVKSGKVTICDAKHFAEYADSILNGITPLYMPLEDVLPEPTNIADAPKMSGTLGVHMVERSFNLNGVCKLEFLQTADDSPFHEQWYRRDDDPEVCGHNELPLSLDSNVLCPCCLQKYKENEEWLECRICDQWFHDECFYK